MIEHIYIIFSYQQLGPVVTNNMQNCNMNVLLLIIKLFCVFGVMQCFYAVRGLKTHYFPHTVHSCCNSMHRLSETRTFLQSSSFWEARRAVIGQISSALWLDEYLECETEMLRPSPYCDAVSQRDETKTINPIINEAFVASSGDIITGYNELYCPFMRCIVLRKH